LVELIERKDFRLISLFKQKYIDWLKKYYFVGGMPEAVVDFLAQKNLSSVRTIQTNLLTAYEQDFSKHPAPFDIPRIRMLWSSLPSQLARENRKFLYGLVRSGARAREYESAIEWLKDSGLIHKVSRITKPGIPLTAYQDMKSFKLFMPDVGLLAAHSRLDSKTILEGNSIFEEFKGALTEQYVLQQLMAMNSVTPFYWSAEKSTGEIDFIFQIEDTIVPLEVKAAENLQSKSLRNFSKKYMHTRSFRTSLADYRKEDWLTNIPLYAINVLKSWNYSA
jgi:predicted AAA+ superfamily ATPase